MVVEKALEASDEGPRSREDRKIRILDAAWRVVNRDGFEGATTRSIAKEAGVNIAMLNYYFQTKEALLSELLDYTARNTLDLVRESLNHSGTVAEVLKKGFASLWGAISRHPELLPFNLVLRSSHDEDARVRSQALYRDYQEVLVQYLSRILEHSGEEITVPLEDFAGSIVTSYNGIILDFMIYRDTEKCERQQELLLQMLLTLVRPR